MLVRQLDFFNFLACQIWDRVEDMRKVMGSLRSCSTWSWRRRRWLGWALGRTFWMTLRRKLLAVLNGHWRSACCVLSSASIEQRSHIWLGMSGMLSLYSLSLVGRRSWIILQRNDDCSEDSPGVAVSVKVCSQSTWGCLSSTMQVLGTCTPLSVCVTLISS